MKIRHALIPAAAAGAAAVLALTLAAPAQAASAVQFRYFRYDSPGSDRGGNSSVNAEYFTLKNVSSRSVSLKGYTVKDSAGYKYTFGTFTLKSGKSVRVHTGKGTNKSTDRYWGRSWYVWNNSGDKATLRSASGSSLDTCSWSRTGSGYKNC
ncbi:lamin tail domain-containing protein [Streptomyces sp. NPDC054796]